ncbi:MAG: hypothetical protein WD206_04340 [Actinomycetota bacterium]
MTVRLITRGLIVCCLALAVTGLTACATNNVGAPMCRTEADLPARVLVAQSIPEATLLPCIEVLPAGWGFGGMTVARGNTVFTLDNDRGGSDALRVSLTPACDVGDARPQRAQGDEIGTSKFVLPIEADDRILPGTTYYRYPGACVTVEFVLPPESPSTLFAEGSTALSFVPRDEVAAQVDEEVGVPLCGAGAPPCPG